MADTAQSPASAPKKLFKPLDKVKGSTPPIKKKAQAASSPATNAAETPKKEVTNSASKGQQQATSAAKVSLLLQLLCLLSPTVLTLVILSEYYPSQFQKPKHRPPAPYTTGFGSSKSQSNLRIQSQNELSHSYSSIPLTKHLSCRPLPPRKHPSSLPRIKRNQRLMLRLLWANQLVLLPHPPRMQKLP